MGWFDAMYGRPGHGVGPDAPRKQGLARFAEIVGRDFGTLLGCNLLCCVLFVPAALLLSLGVVLQQFWLMLVCGALAGLFLGPALRLLASCVLRSLRDDPAPWLPAAWAALKKDKKRTLGFGVLTAELASLALFFVEFLSVAAGAGAYPALPVLVFFGVDALVLATAGCLLWLVLPLDAEAPGRGMLQVLLRGPLRCLGAALVVLADCVAITALFPVSIFWCVLAAFWLPGLWAGQLLYPMLEKYYAIPRMARRTPFEAGSRPRTPAEEKKRRAANWWYYHWGMVAVGALVILGVAYVGHTLLNTVDPDESVAIVTAEALPDETLEALRQSLVACAADRNNDGQVVVEVNNYTWDAHPTAMQTDAQTAGAVRINSDLAQGVSTLWFVEDPAGLEEAYGVFSESGGADWQTALVYGADLPGLAALPEGALLADMAVLQRGGETPLWEALCR